MNLDPEQLKQLLGANGWAEAQALLILILSLVALRLALNWSGGAMRSARVDRSTQILIQRALLISWLVVTLLWELSILGVNPAGLVAIAGAVGLAFSLAIQDILKNFFSGIYLLLERPFRVGDVIRVKDQRGVVENIGVRTTQLRTAENVQVLVPNATVFSEVVTNLTHEEPTVAAADGQTNETDPTKTRA